MNTPVCVFAKAVGAVPECSTARHAVSSNSRCCGSINLTSRVDTPKNGASNPVTSSTKPARRVTIFPGASGSGSKNSSTSHRSAGTSDTASRPCRSTSQNSSASRGTRKARRVADDRKTRCLLHRIFDGCHADVLSAMAEDVPRPSGAACLLPGPLSSDPRRGSVYCTASGRVCSRISLDGRCVRRIRTASRAGRPSSPPACAPWRRTGARHVGDGDRRRGYLDLAASGAGTAAVHTEEKRLRIGKITIGSLDDWTVSPGSVTSWHPTTAAQEKVRQAPVSSVPVSYMQAQHLRGYHERTAAGLDFSRQIIATCEVPGQCDISAMNHALNAYLRRHDTYRSWFEYTGTGEFIRHTIGDPADIEFAPIDHGKMAIDEICDHVVAIPNPLEWGCFTFGIVQSESHFTFYASMDHVHGDATLIGITMLESNGMYSSLSGGDGPLALPDAGSFDDFCARERQYTSTLTVDSPEVRAWIDFAENNNGSFPEFPLPLGNPLEPSDSDMVSELLMDAEQTERFESACTAAGARFIGGLFACIAQVEHEFTVLSPITDSLPGIHAARRKTL